MASNAKNAGARAGRLEKAAQEGASAMAQYEADGRALRAKTARLRELRLARDAAEGPPTAKTAAAKKPTRAKKKKPEPLAEYLDGQQRSGRGG